MRSIPHSYILFRLLGLLAWLLVAVGCSDEVPRNGAGKEWVPVCISETGITDVMVCKLATKSSDRELPSEVKTTFDTDDQLKLTYMLSEAELTAIATKTSGGGWEIKDAAGSNFKLPADFTGEIMATTPEQTPANGYQTNKLKATCTPEYDITNKTFKLSFTFSQESAGIQADVLILSGDPESMQLAYKESSGSEVQYIEFGTSKAFTKTLFFDAGESSQITGFRIVENSSNMDKTFDTPLTLSKGTFYFIDLLIADVNDLNP